MREHFGGILIFAVLAAIIPLSSINFTDQSQTETPTETVQAPVQSMSNTQELEFVPAQDAQSDEDSQGTQAENDSAKTSDTADIISESGTFKIKNLATGKLFKVTAEEYVRGALAAEMPPTFHTEALKAQAVAAHTYALCAQKMQEESPDPELDGADFTADPADWKTYTTEKIFRERYGDFADAYWKAITDAADEVSSYVMLYEGEPIVAAYCSMSTGTTEDAANVWTGSAPYLVPVESRGDLLAPDYETEQRFSVNLIKDALEKAYPGIVLGQVPGEWITLGERSESGYILEVTVGDLVIPAKDLRTLLNLRSTAFDLAYAEEEFRFTVRGYGHGVGLSQYGADYYARQGMDFAEILEHYYPGATLGVAKHQ